MLRLIALLIQAAAPAEQELPSASMLAKAPDLTLTAKGTTDQVATCIGTSVQAGGKPILIRTPETRYVAFGNVKRPLVLVSVSEASPVTVEARSLLFLPQKVRNRIRFCAS